MADIILNSLENSSLAKAMTHNNTHINDYIYKLSKSSVPFSRNKYEIPFKETNFNKEMRLKLLKVGLVQNMTLKIRVKIAGGGTPTEDKGHGDLKSKIGVGFALIKRIALSNGKDELLILNSEVLNYKVSSMQIQKEIGFKLASAYPGAQLDLYANGYSTDANQVQKMQLIHGGRAARAADPTATPPVTALDALDATHAYTTIYVPVLFSPFCHNDPSQYLDFSFFQQLYLNVAFNDRDAVVTGTTDVENMVIDWQKSSLIVNYLNFENPEYSKIQKHHFHKNLNYNFSDYWIFDDQTVSIKKNEEKTVIVDIPCDKLIKKLYIRIHHKNRQKANPSASPALEELPSALGMKGLDAIHKITLSAVGRDVIEFDGQELLFSKAFDSGGGYYHAPFIAKYKKNAVANFYEYPTSEGPTFYQFGDYELEELDSTYYCIDFTLPALSSYGKPVFNGGVSFRNNMNAQLTLKLHDVIFTDTEYDIEVKSFAEHYCIWRINENEDYGDL